MMNRLRSLLSTFVAAGSLATLALTTGCSMGDRGEGASAVPAENLARTADAITGPTCTLTWSGTGCMRSPVSALPCASNRVQLGGLCYDACPYGSAQFAPSWDVVNAIICVVPSTQSLPLSALGSGAQAYSTDVLSDVWSQNNVLDANPSTSYSSAPFATAANDRGTWLGVTMPTPFPAYGAVLHARMYAGAPNGFPAAYWVYYFDSSSSRWTAAYDNNGSNTFTTQPAPDGTVNIWFAGGSEVVTSGVLIWPTSLGVDAYGTHYLQMADVTFLTEADGYVVSQQPS